MKITLSNTLLDSLHTGHVNHIHSDMTEWFHRPSGQEHYRMLMHISYCYNNSKIADIGTYRGASAIALSQNPTNEIFSLDVGKFCNDIPINNIKFCIGDFLTNTEIQENILACNFIFLDIDHMYNNEIWFYNFLIQNNWKGLMICDDINLCDEMKRFWNEISHKKIDITQYGHFSGTGAVIFGDEIDLNLN